MPEISDIRRISITGLILAALLLVWLFFLWLHDAGYFQWIVPERALADLSIGAWMWIGLVAAILLVGVIALPVFSVPIEGKGDLQVRKSIRQVQCQHCKAVFNIPDNGLRPLTYPCPNCKWLGVYDGKAAPVGNPPEPEPARKVTKVELTCGNCKNEFEVTDTGARPLRVTCPECKASGSIQ